MSGWKTYVGTVGWAVSEGLKSVFPEYIALLTLIQTTVFIPLGVVGVAHKIEKAGEIKNG